MRIRIAMIGVAMALLVPGTAAAADGAALYGENCAKCHGDDGRSDTPVGKALKTPALAGGSWSQEELTAAIRDNPKHTSVSSKLSDADLGAILEHLGSLGGGA